MSQTNDQLAARLDAVESRLHALDGQPVGAPPVVIPPINVPAETTPATGSAIAVDATLYKAVHLDSGIRTDQPVAWSLPDGKSRGGFNAAVLFTKAGQLVAAHAADKTQITWRAGTVTTPTLTLVPVGTDLATVIKNGARLLLAAGNYTLSRPVAGTDVIIVDPTNGKAIVKWTGTDRVKDPSGKLYTVTLFNLSDSACHGFTLDSGRLYQIGHYDKDIIPDAFMTGGNLTLVGIKAIDFNKVVNLNNRPKNVLIQGCEGVRPRDYFVWVEGTSIAIYDNVCPDVINNHVIRVHSSIPGAAYGATLLAIDGNTLGNQDHSQDVDPKTKDPANLGKGVIVLQSARYAMVTNNKVNGPWGTGPLLKADNGDPASLCNTVVVVGNTATNVLDIWPGLSSALLNTPQILFQNNKSDPRPIVDVKIVNTQKFSVPLWAHNVTQVAA